MTPFARGLNGSLDGWFGGPRYAVGADLILEPPRPSRLAGGLIGACSTREVEVGRDRAGFEPLRCQVELILDSPATAQARNANPGSPRYWTF